MTEVFKKIKMKLLIFSKAIFVLGLFFAIGTTVAACGSNSSKLDPPYSVNAIEDFLKDRRNPMEYAPRRLMDGYYISLSHGNWLAETFKRVVFDEKGEWESEYDEVNRLLKSFDPNAPEVGFVDQKIANKQYFVQRLAGVMRNLNNQFSSQGIARVRWESDLVKKTTGAGTFMASWKIKLKDEGSGGVISNSALKIVNAFLNEKRRSDESMCLFIRGWFGLFTSKKCVFETSAESILAKKAAMAALKIYESTGMRNYVLADTFYEVEAPYPIERTDDGSDESQRTYSIRFKFIGNVNFFAFADYEDVNKRQGIVSADAVVHISD